MNTLKQKLALLFGLLTGDTARNGPLFVAIDVTQRCNLYCLGCICHSPLFGDKSNNSENIQKDLSFELYQTLCNQLKSYAPCEIILIGEGEPLLHPRLVDMVRLAKQSGLKVRIVTNGTLLDRSMVSQLVEAGLDRIDVSLWAVNPDDAVEVYPKTGRKTFERQMSGLSLLAEAKHEAKLNTPKVLLHQPISKHSAGNVGGLIEIARKYQCNQVSFSPLRVQNDSLLEHAPEGEQLEQLSRLRDELKNDPLGSGLDDILLRYKIGENVLSHQPCYVGWFHLRVDVNGKVMACKMCSKNIGDLNQNSLAEIWNNTEMKKFRKAGRAKNRGDLLPKICECNYCCHVVSNHKIHSKIKWLPL
ncbi:MAG: hypothetical protein DRH08_04255 [Deltaproteobacteria bacterium]|nr:MAG: hypothetical protein DRH08_04255 [Deltaproteobacteria bacterium]